MKRLPLVLILCCVFLNAAGQLLLKVGADDLALVAPQGSQQALALALSVGTQPWILGGLACYVVSTLLWIPALSRVDVMVAYPMVSIGYVVNAFVAWHFMGEALTVQRLVGIGVILLGVVILSRA
jgi:multidrug transporter EmrE-like cation transporter